VMFVGRWIWPERIKRDAKREGVEEKKKEFGA